MTVPQIVERLHELSNPEKVIFKAQKFGINTTNALGIYMKDLNVLAKEIGKNSELAVELFDVAIYEAKILAAKTFKPKDLNINLVKKWTAHFNNWEICDTFSMGVYAKSPLAHSIIQEYSTKTSQFEKRCAFATMAAYCMGDKKAKNNVFERFYPLIIQASSDDRIYVKKAVNWALRSIGKRNSDLKEGAIAVSKMLLQENNSTATWIAKDALKELEAENLRVSDYPRTIYRK